MIPVTAGRHGIKHRFVIPEETLIIQIKIIIADLRFFLPLSNLTVVPVMILPASSLTAVPVLFLPASTVTTIPVFLLPSQTVVKGGVQMIILTSQPNHIPGMPVFNALFRICFRNGDHTPDAQRVAENFDRFGNSLTDTDALAQRVRRIAEEEGIPVLQRLPLARALLRDGNVDQYIPADLIQATAEVLRWLESQQTDTP